MPYWGDEELEVYVEEGATPTYQRSTRRCFIGTQEPDMNNGDIWLDPSEGVTATRAAGDVTFSDSGLTVITGVSNVQAALAAADAALVTVVDLSPTSDTYINQQSTTTNYDTATTLWIGERFDASASFGRVALFAFDVSGVVGTVLSAGLRLTRDEGSPSTALSTSNRLVTRRIKRAFVASEVTWANYSTGNAWQTAGGRGANDVETPTYTAAHVLGDRDQDVWTLDLTEMLKDSLNASDTTLRFQLGWALTTTSQNSVQVASQDNATVEKRPVLTIVSVAA